MTPLALWFAAFAAALGAAQTAPSGGGWMATPCCQKKSVAPDGGSQGCETLSFWCGKGGASPDDGTSKKDRCIKVGVEQTEDGHLLRVTEEVAVEDLPLSCAPRKYLRLAYSREDSCKDGIPLSYTLDVLSYVLELEGSTFGLLADVVSDLCPLETGVDANTLPIPEDLLPEGPPCVPDDARQGLPTAQDTIPATSTPATIKVVPRGEHHVLAIELGDSMVTFTERTMNIGGHALVFTAGKARVHVRGQSFNAFATTVCEDPNGGLLFSGDVHARYEDHGKTRIFKGDKARSSNGRTARSV